MVERARGADLLVRAVKAAGVKCIFTVSGNQIMSVFDACRDAEIQLIHTRHEAAAVHMADAWGRLTGQPGVAIVPAGPGLANALSALYVAKMAESPAILISGQAPSQLRGRGAFQEIPQVEMAHFVSKASWAVRGSNLLVFDIARALAVAMTGRPGPVHLGVPINMLESRTRPISHRAPNPDEFAKDARKMFVDLDGHSSTGEQILEWLALAQRPLILAGPAPMRGTGKQILERLSQVLKVPVLGMESPRGVNDPSLGALAEILPEADLIILLGKKLDYTLLPDGEPLFNKDCRFIQFDPDMAVLELTGRALGERQKQLLPLMTTYEKLDPGVTRKEQAEKTEKQVMPALFDPLPTAQRLVNLAGQREWERSDWYDKVAFATAFRPADWSTLAAAPGAPLHALEICRAVSQFLAGDDQAVFISDGGEFGQWAQASIQAPHRIINGPSGAIGNAIPFAVAARLARPEARIVAMTGDGAFGFGAMEFDTALRYELPFVAVVGNDAAWNAEYQIQLRKFGQDRAIGCQLLPSRYDEMVKALGGFGCHVEQATELRSALEEANASKLPACINVSMQSNPAPVMRRNP